MKEGPIGIFDSGYGGLTVLKEIIKILPENDFLYFGDNARTPYGSRSFNTIYEYTLECVKYLFKEGCPLVILACNTASAKALRNIQQKVLPIKYPDRRALGVIRPTAEVVSSYSKTGKVGVLGTVGTVNSESYIMEIRKQSPDLEVYQQACPMWVPLVENGEHIGDGADFFVQKYLKELFSQSEDIDTLLLACTHYPLLIDKIRQHIPSSIQILNQGEIVAPSLKNYLTRHPEITEKCTKNGDRRFLTTDSTDFFNLQGRTFFGEEILSEFVHL